MGRTGNTILIPKKTVKEDNMIKKIKDAMQYLNSSGKCSFRLAYKFPNTVSSWSRYIIFPSIEFVEIDYPVHYSEIETIDLQCIVEKKAGRLMPPKFENNTDEVALLLTKCKVNYHYLDDGIIQIKVGENEDGSISGNVSF
jgi:hypothetical protein